jgi:hypothetical protein
VIGLLFGVLQLLAPVWFANLFGLPADPALFRLVGAAILGFTATSFLATRATAWSEVRLVVLGEIVWTWLATICLLGAVLSGTWPAIAWLNIIIMLGFALAFSYFYYAEARAPAARLRPSPR